MKKILGFLLVAVLFLSTTSCVKENHSVRFRNNFRETISNVKIGSASIGTVRNGNVSDYKSINTGDFQVSGQSQTAGPLVGTGSISGKGKHRWTLTLSSQGTISMSEDK